MTTTYRENDQVVHRIYGRGYVVRPLGQTRVEVQWTGVPYTRREHIENVERYVPPTPTRRRRAA